MRVSSRIASALLAGAALLAVGAAPAMAQQAPAGEVEALRAQVQALMARIEKLERAPSTPAGPPAGKDAPMVAADAYKAPQIVQSGNNKYKLTLTGWVNRMVTYADDGVDNDFTFTDNNGASSRFRLTGAAKLNDEWSAGTDLELEAISANSRSSGLYTDSGSFSLNERKIEFYIESTRLGRLTVGQGDTASNIASEVDLSGTANLGGYSDIGATFGGIQMRNKATGAFGGTINALFSNLDGLHREDRVRYDTPTFGGGFVGSTSVTEGGAMDAVLRYSGKMGGATVAGALAYSNSDSRDLAGFDFGDQVNGSISVRLENGFSVTVAGGTRDQKAGFDTNFWYGKLGYMAKMNSLGNTAFSIDYFTQDDLGVRGSEGDAYGAWIVQVIDGLATDLYAGVRNHQYKTPTTNFHDVTAVMTGARVRF
ncbi:hypothetical protein [Niveispirillum fermenti]|uniref:hypothetical protein n=1 Tax=Niveispirillum fermenti TaxID=1233113 RepID=UPI003A8781D3